MAKDITLAEVRHMAMLSRLLISDDEEKLFSHQFSDILAHMEVLNEVDTGRMEPLYSPSQHPGFNREDFAVDMRTRSEILANAPETDGECFIVPRII